MAVEKFQKNNPNVGRAKVKAKHGDEKEPLEVPTGGPRDMWLIQRLGERTEGSVFGYRWPWMSDRTILLLSNEESLLVF